MAADTGQDATIYAGEDRKLRFTVSNTDPTALTDIRYVVEGVKELDYDLGDSEVTAVDSTTIDVDLPSSVTKGLSPASRRHALWAKPSNGEWVVIATGTLTIRSQFGGG